LNSPSPGGGRKGGGFSASEHSSPTPRTASPTPLVAPLERGEVPESHLKGRSAMRGQHATQLPPASIDAQLNTTLDALSAPFPTEGTKRSEQGRPVPQPSLPTLPTLPNLPTLRTPTRPPQTPTASSQQTTQTASPPSAATVPP
jgi:hypothetical protein